MSNFYIDKRAVTPSRLALFGLLLGLVGFIFVAIDGDRKGLALLSVVGTTLGIGGIVAVLLGVVLAFSRLGGKSGKENDEP